MKKKLVFLLTFSISTATYAQLKVFSNGNVAIGDTLNTPNSRLSVNYHGDGNFAVSILGKQHGLFSYRTDSSNDYSWSYGIEGRSDNYRTAYSIGVKAAAMNYGGPTVNVGRAYGVLSQVKDAQSGCNYAVLGNLLGVRNGAAIYGSIADYDAGVTLNDRYAGYFYGRTKVEGLLEASSVDFGVIIIPVLPSMASNGSHIEEQQCESDKNTTEKLAELSVITYNREAQKLTTTKFPESEEASEEEVELPMSNIELQNIEKQHYGIDVEQLEAAFPELVYNMDDGSKGINYVEMIPLLVQSIRELKAEIESMKKAGYTVSKARTATSVDAVKNGKDTTSSEESIHDVAGRFLTSQPQHGIYIQNGRKKWGR